MKKINWGLAFIVCIVLPLIIFYLNKDIDALIAGEIHGRRGSVYSRILNPRLFWFHFSLNLIIPFFLAVASVKAIFSDSEKK